MRAIIISAFGLALVSCSASEPVAVSFVRPTVEAAEAYAIKRVGVEGASPVWAVPASNGRSICGIVRLETGEDVAYQYSISREKETALMAIYLAEPRNRQRMIPAMNSVVQGSCAEAGVNLPLRSPSP